MAQKILFLPGDGIGYEVMNEAYKVLKAVAEKHELDFEISSEAFGGKAIDKYGHPFPEEVLEKCLASDAIMLGAVGDPKYDNNPDLKVRPEQGLLMLRKSLGVYLNIRPLHTYKALYDLSPLKKEKIKGVNFEIYRELTGGIYFGERGIDKDGNTYDTCTYSRKEIERVVRPAFERAMERNKKLTIIDKANVLDTSRLWRKIGQEISKDFPEVELNFLFVDNAAMQMILNPVQFDVIATSNMFGDIISDEASVIAGSIGLLASASIGDGVGIFEPIHGSYPQAAGQNKANPLGAILSVSMMLNHLGHHEAALDIYKAVTTSINHGYVTEDISDVDYYFCSKVGDFIELLISDEKFYLNLLKHEVSRNTII